MKGWLLGGRRERHAARDDADVDLPSAIATAGATLVALPSLWAFHDTVKVSSLTFSMIRMRNAAACS